VHLISPQINSECTNIYLNQVLCVASKPYPYVLPTNITSSPDSTSSVTSTVLPTNVPTAGPDAGSDDGDVVTSTAEVWATVTQSAEGASETSSVSGVSTLVWCYWLCVLLTRYFILPRLGSWNTVKRATNPRIAWTKSRCRTATRSRSSSSLHGSSP
jgi:hypothetical protein